MDFDFDTAKNFGSAPGGEKGGVGVSGQRPKKMAEGDDSDEQIDTTRQRQGSQETLQTFTVEESRSWKKGDQADPALARSSAPYYQRLRQ